MFHLYLTFWQSVLCNTARHLIHHPLLGRNQCISVNLEIENLNSLFKFKLVINLNTTFVGIFKTYFFKYYFRNLSSNHFTIAATLKNNLSVAIFKSKFLIIPRVPASQKNLLLFHNPHVFSGLCKNIRLHVISGSTTCLQCGRTFKK